MQLEEELMKCFRLLELQLLWEQLKKILIEAEKCEDDLKNSVAELKKIQNQLEKFILSFKNFKITFK